MFSFLAKKILDQSTSFIDLTPTLPGIKFSFVLFSFLIIFIEKAPSPEPVKAPSPRPITPEQKVPPPRPITPEQKVLPPRPITPEQKVPSIKGLFI